MLENKDSFVYGLRGKDVTWTPIRIVNGRVLCSTEAGDRVLFDKTHIAHIRFLDEILKRRKNKSISAESKV